MRKLLVLSALGAFSLVATNTAQAHLVRKADHPKKSVLENRLAQQTENLKHASYVCNNGRRVSKTWHCKAKSWISTERKETIVKLNPPVNWVSIQIYYATLIAKASKGDPWPNCSDPYDGSGSSWQDTVNCENHGNWYDSPGFYRCGLQFDPMWERHYGRRFCP